MGIFEFAGSVISSVASGISNACGSIGSAVSSFVTGVGSVIAGAISGLAPVAEAIEKFANSFLQGMGVLKSNENIEDMGERALQAAEAGITIDRFENFGEYMQALRDFNLDPKISENRDSRIKLMAGISIGTVGVEKKLNASEGSLGGLWLLAMSNPAYFTPERMQDLVSTGRLGSNVFDYLEGRLSDVESRRFEKPFEVDANGQKLSKNELNQQHEALDIARNNYGKTIQTAKEMA